MSSTSEMGSIPSGLRDLVGSNTALLGRATAYLRASTTHPGCAPRGLPSTRIVRIALRAGRSMEGTMACMARPAQRAGALGLGTWSMLGRQDSGSEPEGDLVGRGPSYGAAVCGALHFRIPGCQVGWALAHRGCGRAWSVQHQWCARSVISPGKVLGCCDGGWRAGRPPPQPSRSRVEEPPGHGADFVEEMQGGHCLSARHGA